MSQGYSSIFLQETAFPILLMWELDDFIHLNFPPSQHDSFLNKNSIFYTLICHY